MQKHAARITFYVPSSFNINSRPRRLGKYTNEMLWFVDRLVHLSDQYPHVNDMWFNMSTKTMLYYMGSHHTWYEILRWLKNTGVMEFEYGSLSSTVTMSFRLAPARRVEPLGRYCCEESGLTEKLEADRKERGNHLPFNVALTAKNATMKYSSYSRPSVG